MSPQSSTAPETSSLPDAARAALGYPRSQTRGAACPPRGAPRRACRVARPAPSARTQACSRRRRSRPVRPAGCPRRRITDYRMRQGSSRPAAVTGRSARRRAGSRGASRGRAPPSRPRGGCAGCPRWSAGASAARGPLLDRGPGCHRASRWAVAPGSTSMSCTRPPLDDYSGPEFSEPSAGLRRRPGGGGLTFFRLTRSRPSAPSTVDAVRAPGIRLAKNETRLSGFRAACGL